MPQRDYIFIIAWFLLIPTGWGCSSNDLPSAKGSTQIVKDDLGREVLLARNPQRLVSLSPNITEMLFAIGLGAQVVGVTSYCDYPPEARTKAKIGDIITPSLESILTLKPDLVLVSRVSTLQRFDRRLEEVGVPRYVVDARNMEDILRALRRLGSVLGRSGQAEAVAKSLEQRLRQIEQRVQGAVAPRVLLVIQREPLMVPGQKTFLADLVRRAGGTLVGPDDEREGVLYSLESVIAQQPETIILPSSETGTRRVEHFAWPKLAETPAIRDQKIYSITADLIMRPGPRLVDGLSELARILQPDLFKQYGERQRPEPPSGARSGETQVADAPRTVPPR
jgi:iron complex transport system substrate-binding protein